ncbi:MAG: alpha/beta fold hydrolase [Bermanella sp.]
MQQTYESQQSWREIQSHLPQEYRFNRESMPEEDYWNWRGHTVHLDRYRNETATHKIIQLHGVGTNGRMMSSIVGRPLADRGYETVAIDLLNYGETHVAAGHKVSYQDWVDQVVDFIAYERSRDERPIILYGLSAGGMLAYHAAAIDKNVAGVVGMCFMDMRMKYTKKKVVRWEWMGSKLSFEGLVLYSKLLGKITKVPMTLLSKMTALVNDKAALKACLADKTSAGNWVTIDFAMTLMTHKPAMELEDFDVCPILLTQPAADTWTPLEISTPVMERIKKVKKDTVMLDNAGHYPIEHSGLKQMEHAIVNFIEKLN